MKQELSPETPVNVEKSQLRALVFGITASTLAMACSFGEVSGSEPLVDLTDPSEAPGAVTDTAEDTSQSVTPAAPSAPAPTRSVPADDPAQDVNPDEDPFATELGKQVRSILEVNCGNCHQVANSGGMDYILNMRELVKNGKIIPGNKSDSDLYVRMAQQNMPPAFERTQRPTQGQIDQVGLFIDELPVDLFEAKQECDPQEFVTSDDQIEAMSSDLQRLDADDQVFTRYLTINYSANNATSCELAINRQRYALFKGINSVSINPQVTQPIAIDADETIFRIDLRDYDWDREIDLEDDGVVDFADAWEAIIATAGPYALQLAGDQADDLVQDSGTAVPFLPVNAFTQFTQFGDLYYSLTGAKANLFDFEREVLLVDTAAEIADNQLMRAGYSNSGVSKQERVLNRFDQGTAGGLAYWISFDFDGGGVQSQGNESIYQDPLGFAFAGGEAIYSLPNGLQAYYVANAAGARLAEAPVGVVIDPAQNNGVVTNGASCHSCHNAGIITFTDAVRQFVVENRTLFDNETYEDVLEQYPLPAEFNRISDQDSRQHIAAVERSGVPPKTPDPISRVYLDFQLRLDADAAAAELQVTKKELLDNLDLLDPQLAALAAKDGRVERAVFTNNYLDSFCRLHTVDENQPVNCP